MNWKTDKAWSDIFIPTLKGIIGMALIKEGDAVQDALENTDLISLSLDRVRIGCRVRRMQYYNKFKDDFTIRCDRPSGNKSELRKILNGWGDYFIYGFGNEKEPRKIKYFVGNLDVFRDRYIFLDRKVVDNHDGSSSFMTIPIQQPDLKDFVIHSNYLKGYKHDTQ